MESSLKTEVKERPGVKFKTVLLKKVPPKDKRIGELISWGKRFCELGITPRTSGNLSFRTPACFVITGAGTMLGFLKGDDFVKVSKVEVGRGQMVVSAEGKLKPSSESMLHWEIFRQRPEINAIFHLHDEEVMKASRRMSVPCTVKKQPAGTYALAREVKKLLESERETNYCILKDHGIISLGKAVKEAGQLVEMMNKSARDVERGAAQ